MKQTKKTEIIGSVALRLGFYVLAVFISIPISLLSIFLRLFPLITTIIAIIFVIKTIIDGRKECRRQNKRLGIAYFITAGAIALFQIGLVYMYIGTLINFINNYH